MSGWTSDPEVEDATTPTDPQDLTDPPPQDPLVEKLDDDEDEDAP